MKSRIPSYRRHKARSCAVVTIAGKDHYLGPYGSVESHERYGQLIAQHASQANVVDESPRETEGRSIDEIVLAFLRHAKKYYVKKGRVTAEYGMYKCASRPLVKLYGPTDAEKFDVCKLRAVQTEMITTPVMRRGKPTGTTWSRRFINKSICRIRHVFRWAKANGLLKTKGLVEDLKDLEPLLAGRTDAVELPERSPVPEEHLQMVRAKINQRSRDIIDLCLITGGRPGEILSLTTRIIDRSSDIWTAELTEHKAQHHGKTRTLAFGPKAQLILKKYLTTAFDRKLFQIRRDTFSKSLVYWCDKLKIPRFTGHWLRHNAATNIRRKESLDDAQALLGHSDQKTTQRYAKITDERIINLARKHG